MPCLAQRAGGEAWCGPQADTTCYLLCQGVLGSSQFYHASDQPKRAGIMLTVGNGTVGASDTGSASGYKLELSHLLNVLFLFLYKLSANSNNLDDVIILLFFNNIMIYFMTFEIKIYCKMQRHYHVGMGFRRCAWSNCAAKQCAIRSPTSTIFSTFLLTPSSMLIF
jgi:hypothetical protein